MGQTLYFYDLETSGIDTRTARVMQFAGQRTDLNLKPIGEPDIFFIKMTDDHLPDPDAILVTGITPQRTREEGITEAEFLRYFTESIAIPDTIFTGFNTIRFDDEFMRFMHYRNFYDPYAWQWQDGRSRWDLLDVVRMTRALRPDGIKWPFASDGRPSNQLTLLTSINGLDHEKAHDALNDVNATIVLARLLRNKQIKLFDYLLGMRSKQKVSKLVSGGQPFVYCSGKYPGLYEKTTVVSDLGIHPGKQGNLVFDLRADPLVYKDMTPEEIATAWAQRHEDETKRFPVKTLQFNRCPAIAPVSVLDEASIERLHLNMTDISKHQKSLASDKKLYDRLLKALEIMDKHRQAALLASELDVDCQLYDGFLNDGDKNAMGVVRAAEPESLAGLELTFKDDRLNKLFPLYKARNFPGLLSPEEREAWEKFRYHRLMDGGGKAPVSRYFSRLGEIAKKTNLSSDEQYLLKELQLYGESILPEALDRDETDEQLL